MVLLCVMCWLCVDYVSIRRCMRVGYVLIVRCACVDSVLCCFASAMC